MDIEDQYDNACLDMDILIAWIGGSNSFDPNYDPRLSQVAWKAMQDMAVKDPAVKQRVGLLRGISQSQVVLPDIGK
jgi:hypothetical protein